MSAPNLYHALILEHNKNPRNFKKLDPPCMVEEGRNSSCGDHLSIYFQFDDDQKVLTNLSFEGDGCAIAKASASFMTVLLCGKTIKEALAIFQEFQLQLSGKLDLSKAQRSQEALEILSCMNDLSKYPARKKCSSLAWDTLMKALASNLQKS